jgi:hypothetical protein
MEAQTLDRRQDSGGGGLLFVIGGIVGLVVGFCAGVWWSTNLWSSH